MSATDELRRLMDERGVEWKAPASYDGSTKYDTIVDEYWFHEYDGRITVHGLTPEQAIEASFGRGECHIETTANWLPARCYHRCTTCGAFFAVMDASGDIVPNCCPNCKRKVIDA